MSNKTAGFFIINKENKILVGHPTNHLPDFWSIFKGMVEEGEDELDAAIREVMEESNVDLSNCKTFHKLSDKSFKNGRKILVPFIIFESENDNLSLNLNDIKCSSFVEPAHFPEMDDFKFITLDEAELYMHEAQKRCLSEIRKLIY